MLHAKRNFHGLLFEEDAQIVQAAQQNIHALEFDDLIKIEQGNATADWVLKRYRHAQYWV